MNHSRIKQTAKCIVTLAVFSLALCLPMSANAEMMKVLQNELSKLSCKNASGTPVYPGYCAIDCIKWYPTAADHEYALKCLINCALFDKGDKGTTCVLN